MRILPEALAASLNSGVTTLCRCWKLVRSDGTVLGFTDHDRDLSFEGVVFRADSGLDASSVEAATGLGVDSHSVTGALRSEAIDEADIERGLFDGAEVALWMVDWSDVESRVLLSRGFVGEIRRQGAEFEAEVVGLAERLNQPVGRAYLPTCDASLGDARCGVATGQPQWRGEATVVDVLAAHRFAVTGIEGFAGGFFTNGACRWTGGANEGLRGHVRQHGLEGQAVIALWTAPPMTVGVGDTVELVAGCDKIAGTCRSKLSNIMNFRGFPHVPGDDWAVGYPDEGGSHDGGSLFRG